MADRARSSRADCADHVALARTECRIILSGLEYGCLGRDTNSAHSTRSRVKELQLGAVLKLVACTLIEVASLCRTDKHSHRIGTASIVIPKGRSGDQASRTSIPDSKHHLEQRRRRRQAQYVRGSVRESTKVLKECLGSRTRLNSVL